jgi:hypothetical protein
MSLTTAHRKKLQRQRDRALGWVEVTVKVAAGRADEVREFAASLPVPTPPTDPDQLSLIELIDGRLDKSGEEGDPSQGRMNF